MKTLPINANDDEIRQLVVEWNRLLSNEQYKEAIELFSSYGEKTWSPEQLEKTISGYGIPCNSDDETLLLLLNEWGVEKFVMSPIHIEKIDSSIEVDRDNLYGMNPNEYLGMVHFFDIPLCGYLSDLTARFNIRRVEEEKIILELIDIHVM